jgi:hypothetical protein
MYLPHWGWGVKGDYCEMLLVCCRFVAIFVANQPIDYQHCSRVAGFSDYHISLSSVPSDFENLIEP